jgi:hypothetical protein
VADGVVMFGAVTLEEQFRAVVVLESVVGGRIGTGIFVDPRQRHHQPEFDEHRVQRRRCSQRHIQNAHWFSCQQSSFFRFSRKQHIIFFLFFPQVFAYCNAFAKMDFYNSLVKEKCTSLTTRLNVLFHDYSLYFLPTTII